MRPNFSYKKTPRKHQRSHVRIGEDTMLVLVFDEDTDMHYSDIAGSVEDGTLEAYEAHECVDPNTIWRYTELREVRGQEW